MRYCFLDKTRICGDDCAAFCGAEDLCALLSALESHMDSEASIFMHNNNCNYEDDDNIEIAADEIVRQTVEPLTANETQRLETLQDKCDEWGSQAPLSDEERKEMKILIRRDNMYHSLIAKTRIRICHERNMKEVN